MGLRGRGGRRGNLEGDVFVECLGTLPERLPDFAPAPPAADRAAWDAVPGWYRRRLEEAAARLGPDWPELTATDYMDYTRTGNRARFEARYLGRRRMLNTFVMAECASGDGRYIDRIVDGIFLICEESGWQLPAHNTHVRDAAALPLPDPARPVIDLFAAETGALLACAAAALADRLDAASPLIRQRIDDELQRRILRPYLGAHFWWMGDPPLTNWTAWCIQNVLFAAFVGPTDQHIRRAVITKAAASLDAFVDSYGEDGACDEGVLYYRHAALCLFNALNVLSAVAPAAFAPLWSAPKLRAMAEYLPHMHAQGPWYFNFADAPARPGPCGAREFLFGQAVSSALLARQAAADWRDNPAPEEADDLGINLFYSLQAAQAVTAMSEADHARPAASDHFFSSIGLMVARDARFALAVKAGHNGESHNHNDVGSFTLFKDGRPLLIDVGVETYTAQTFSAARYEIWTMQSGYHNLPAFGGVMQGAGAGFRARDVTVRLTDAQARMDMEIAGAYPPEAGLRSYRRSVSFRKSAGIEIVDEFEGDLAPVLSLMVAEAPSLASGLILIGDLAVIELGGAGEPVIEPIAIADPRLRATWPERIYRLLVPFAGDRLVLRVT